MAVDLKKGAKLMKKADATIKALKAENAKLTARLNVKTKIAAMVKGGRKLAEVVEEVVTEVKDKLTEAGVPAEAVEQAADIVETAVTEAELQAPEGEAAKTSDEEMEVLDDQAKAELADIATSDDATEEAKLAAMKLVKESKCKSAFGKELVKAVKKLSSNNMGGSIAKINRNGSGSAVSPALQSLRNFANKQ